MHPCARYTATLQYCATLMATFERNGGIIQMLAVREAMVDNGRMPGEWPGPALGGSSLPGGKVEFVARS